MKRKKKTKRKLQYDQLDEICKQIIILRDDCTCQVSGKNLEDEEKHPHHLTKRSKSIRLRWDLLNIILLSKGWHCKFTNDEVLGDKWFREKFPARYEYLWALIPKEDQFTDAEILVPRRNCLKTWRSADLDELEVELKEKLADLKGGA